MDQIELNRLCQSPGQEGALWRLVRSWDPDKVAQWLMSEKARGSIAPMDAASCVAEVMAGAAFVFAQRLSGDRANAILGSGGLCAMMRASVEHKLTQVGGAHNIITGNKRIILPQ
jgi:hypothetical protein